MGLDGVGRRIKSVEVVGGGWDNVWEGRAKPSGGSSF